MNLAIIGTGNQGSKVLLPAAKGIFENVELFHRSEYDKVLNDKNFDAVALALPPQIQGQFSPALLASGKHLFLEKPISTNILSPICLCYQNFLSNKKIMVNFGFRFVESFKTFRNLIKSGEMGKIEMISVNWLLNSRRDESLTWNWKSDKEMGGGTLNLLGSHVLDYLFWFFDELKLVNCSTWNIIKYRNDSVTKERKECTADDTVFLHLRAGDIPINVNISTAVSINQSHNITIYSSEGEWQLKNTPVSDTYDDFSISWFGAGEYTKNWGGLERNTRIDIAKKAFQNFACLIRGEDVECPKLEDGLRVQEILELAHNS